MSTRHYHQQQLGVSHLQNNYTLNVTLKINAEEEVSSRCIVESNLDNISGRKKRISDEIYFLLCQSCFWCASYTSPFLYKRMTKETITNCPSCNEEIQSHFPQLKMKNTGLIMIRSAGLLWSSSDKIRQLSVPYLIGKCLNGHGCTLGGRQDC